MTFRWLRKAHRGYVMAMPVTIMFGILFMFFLVYTVNRVSIVVSGARETMRGAVINAVADNYYPAYDGMRENTMGAHDADNAWADSSTNGNILENVENFLGLTPDSNGYEEDANGREEYSISNISVSVSNPALRDSNTPLKITAAYTLNVYMPLNLPPISVGQTISTKFEPKF